MDETKNSMTFDSRVTVPTDHPAFPGHFPGYPILPGVLILERILSLAASKIEKSLIGCSLANIKFVAPVLPGDTLDLQLQAASDFDYRFSVSIEQSDGLPAVLSCTGQLRLAKPASQAS